MINSQPLRGERTGHEVPGSCRFGDSAVSQTENAGPPQVFNSPSLRQIRVSSDGDSRLDERFREFCQLTYNVTWQQQ